MKEKIRAYLDHIFQDAAETEAVKETKEELLANLCDRYDDWIAQGKTPDEAYQAVIDGIGDEKELRDLVCGKGVGLPVPTSSGTRSDAAKESAFPSVPEVSVKWLSGNVLFLPSPDMQIHVAEVVSPSFPERFLFQASLNGSRLVIKDPRRDLTAVLLGLGWFAMHHSADLFVYLPGSALSRLSAEQVSGDVEVRGIRSQSLYVETVSGNILGSGLFDSARVHSVSGRVSLSSSMRECHMESVSGRLRLDGRAGQIRMSTTSGRVELSLDELPESMTVETVSGRVEAALPENDGFTLHYDKVSGKFSSEFPMMERDNDRIYKNGSARYKISTVSGGCSILRRYSGINPG